MVGHAGTTSTLAAFGIDETLSRALAPLGPSLAGDIALDISRDSWAKGLVYDALVRALCRGLPLYARLHGRGHSLSVSRPIGELSRDAAQHRRLLLSKLRAAYQSELVGPVPGTSGKFAEGLDIRLEQADDRWWVVFEPVTFIDFERRHDSDDAERSSIEWRKAEDWRRERWVQKYNHRWSAILDAWVELLAHSRGVWRSACDLQDADGIDARFELGPRTARSRPAHDHDYFHARQGQP